ncbi:SPX-domain-containing protein [Coemansia reversa NRRL 1564]|uniref:SPX-domain-containing protein n=1 Tax=Coemansia reversa (strain ATCC 12441 / NRRL 1564) TaxID=763665 RepID=A0A2G5BL17_COERN|nr:SPX-domain-containing protein [Coemansia reversa NRRL 1564]|eukprot:PIA19698.1 SPX-domain-containing protein [Coemansia reversa NRRL 1564]
MKFSSALQFNAVPDWAQYYLDYSGLKKKLYAIERDIIATEAQSLITTGGGEEHMLLEPQTQAYATFEPLLEAELGKVDRFYRRKEAEIFSQADALERDVNKVEGRPTLQRRGSYSFTRKPSSMDEDGYGEVPRIRSASTELLGTVGAAGQASTSMPDSGDEDVACTDATHTDADSGNAQRTMSFSEDETWRQALRGRARDVFILLYDLRSYAQLNYTGFSKITKKFDKVTNSQLRTTFMEQTAAAAYVFTAEAQKGLRAHMEAATLAFGLASHHESAEDALHELKRSLREEVVWERNTVWRDMIARERMGSAVGVQTPDVGVNVPDVVGVAGKRRLTGTQRQLLRVVACTAVAAAAWALPLFDGGEQQRCWALLVHVSLLWASEALPLHVTALLVPLLAVILRVMRAPDAAHSALDAKAAAHAVFASMFSPVVMLLLGGFALAAALSKHDIARVLASWVLARAGAKPRAVLLANMLVATFASMWISNVAAPVLCFSLARPILRTLPPASPFAPCLILGIALAANVGGMASPISSPQNIIALGAMHPPPSWMQWLAVSVPVCLACDVAIWMLLLLVYRPHHAVIRPTRFAPEPLTRRQIYVCVVAVLTIALWCLAPRLTAVFGDMGVIAVVPLVLLFASPHILSKEDFNNFLWTVVVLAMGGIALGRAVESSGLLHELASHIELLVDGLPLFAVLCVFCALVLVCCTFVSHTVGALIVLPIVAEVGARLPEPHSRLLVMGSALMASGAMGLPVSGFPNMNAIMLEDNLGNPYLTTIDFFKVGVPSSIVAYFIIVSIAYVIMLLLGF